jgi:L-alanine-DL-glutamate epimerase-like enolase superfamily enzyme
MKNKHRISEIHIYKSDIKLKEPFKIAIMEITDAKSIFIRIVTDTGIYGMGEANPYWAITGETQAMNFAGAPDIAKLLLKKDPLDIEGRISEINNFLAHNSTLRSAFDMALYDLLGKIAALPLYTLLGGSNRPIYTDNTIGIADPDSMAAKAVKFKQQGFHAIKVKLGTNAKLDIQRIEKIRQAVGTEIPMRIDANQGWDYKTALNVLKAIEPMGVEYCEQPVPYWTFEDLRRLRENTSIAIMADESLFDQHDALRLASMGCCDYFNIKLSKSGGLHTALKINAIAEAAGITCMVGCMTETRLALTAAAHLVSAKNNIKYADLDGNLMLELDPVIGGAEYNAGEIRLPDTPGHGADIDPDFLNQCECVTVK